jgi:transcriptional regulator with XRE-family HTH domain
MNEFGKAFREERLKKKKTLREVAAYTNKSIGYLSDIEHGRKGAPDLETARKIEEFFLITDNRLVTLASQARRTVPNYILQHVQSRPALADILMRADDFTDEELQDILARKDAQGKV